MEIYLEGVSHASLNKTWYSLIDIQFSRARPVTQNLTVRDATLNHTKVKWEGSSHENLLTSADMVLLSI